VLVQPYTSPLLKGKAIVNDSSQGGNTYDTLAAYGQSNVARVMFAKRLAEKLSAKKIRVYSIDPGGS
jgi:NAD(P)-dependent dehydrogenase (short-subunit alcohol dehydrogenase family)